VSNNTPPGRTRPGAAAGVVGTAALTAYQTLRSVRKGTPVREAVRTRPAGRVGRRAGPGRLPVRAPPLPEGRAGVPGDDDDERRPLALWHGV